MQRWEHLLSGFRAVITATLVSRKPSTGRKWEPREGYKTSLIPSCPYPAGPLKSEKDHPTCSLSVLGHWGWQKKISFSSSPLLLKEHSPFPPAQKPYMLPSLLKTNRKRLDIVTLTFIGVMSLMKSTAFSGIVLLLKKEKKEGPHGITNKWCERYLRDSHPSKLSMEQCPLSSARPEPGPLSWAGLSSWPASWLEAALGGTHGTHAGLGCRGHV